MKENPAHIVVVDTSSGGVLVAIFANSRPKVSLARLGVSRKHFAGSIAGQGGVGSDAYMIDERIRRNVVVAGKFGQCQAFSTLRHWGTGSRPFWGHFEKLSRARQPKMREECGHELNRCGLARDANAAKWKSSAQGEGEARKQRGRREYKKERVSTRWQSGQHGKRLKQ